MIGLTVRILNPTIRYNPCMVAGVIDLIPGAHGGQIYFVYMSGQQPGQDLRHAPSSLSTSTPRVPPLARPGRA